MNDVFAVWVQADIYDDPELIVIRSSLPLARKWCDTHRKLRKGTAIEWKDDFGSSEGTSIIQEKEYTYTVRAYPFR